MITKIKMHPHISEITGESGINRVIEAYYKYLPEFGIKLVKPDAKPQDYDLTVSHAGNTGANCDIAHLHGMYFTSDYPSMPLWAWRTNARIAEAIRHAKQVTVPSDWVAEILQRDARINPHVIPHGIDWKEWQHNEQSQGYVLWNKNRIGVDVCDNSILIPLADAFSDIKFLSTFPPISGRRNNIQSLSKHNKPVPHEEMKLLVQQAGVYLSTTKETFGLGVLEAMASGIPVLGWNYGGNSILVEHSINGYLAEPNNFDDLCEGLVYCFKYRKQLGANGIELTKKWTWQDACEQVANVYRLALKEQKSTVSVIIPTYNKPAKEVERAIGGCLNQTLKPDKIIVVDDGSDTEYEWLSDGRYGCILEYIRQSNQGVAAARNNGISQTNSKYICCLDSDDWIEPAFLETCVKELEQDSSLGIVYTGLMAHIPDKEPSVSEWPPDFDYDKQLQKHNQVPTCCVFRRDAWERAGGYRSRYCPQGAGSEDAAFWTAVCSIGYNAKKVTDEPLFNYSFTTGMASGNPNYQEVNWLQFYPWVLDGQHPFTSIAIPRNESHPIRQYDEPVISVVIPVGPGHEKEVINALDSLEMQHFRKWEVIIIDDIGQSDELDSWHQIRKAFPYIKWIETNHKGAGYARNRGVEQARGDLIFFLDADDMLASPDALDLMLREFNKNQGVIYSDYLGKAIWQDENAAREAYKHKFLHYNKRQQVAVFRNNAADFDCAKAQKQPEKDTKGNVYHWCLISVLMPKAWHQEIGGFDEEMGTWEDVDYLWRLSKTGHCFYRIKKELVLYNYHKGNRRELSAVRDEASLQEHEKMIQYIISKYERIDNVVCNCGKRKEPPIQESQVNDMANNLVLIEFHFPGDDTRAKWGRPLKSSTGQVKNGQVIDYHGYSRRSGDRFLVHIEDQKARPDMFKLVPEEVKIPKSEKKKLEKPKPIVEIAESQLDLSQLPRMTPMLAQRFNDAGLNTKPVILEAGISGLTKIKGIGSTTAKKIIEYLEELE